jgi:hypothetical protein
MDIRRVLAFGALGFVLAACASAVEPLNVGEPAEMAGLNLLVTKVVVGGDDVGPWLQVWFRMKSVSDHEVPIPAAAIACHGDESLGAPAPVQDRHYAIRPGALIFVGSSAAGVMRLLVPGDSRDGSERPTCRTPAYVRVTDGAELRKIKIPDPVVKGLNAY